MSISLGKLRELAEKAAGEPHMLIASDPETVTKLLDAVEVLKKVRACRTDKGWIIGGHPGLTQLLPAMDEALSSFTE